jgi:hypothetical protein
MRRREVVGQLKPQPEVLGSTVDDGRPDLGPSVR